MADPMIPDPTVLEAFVKGSDGAARIAAAESDVRRVCGWHVAPSATETVLVSSRRHGCLTLWLPSMHVTAVTEVRDPDGIVVDPDTYVWTEAGAVELSTYGWWGSGLYAVDFTHGYTTVPEELRDVILARAARANADPTGRLAQVSRGPFSEQYNTGGVTGFDPDREREIIARYRIPRTR